MLQLIERKIIISQQKQCFDSSFQMNWKVYIKRIEMSSLERVSIKSSEYIWSSTNTFQKASIATFVYIQCNRSHAFLDIFCQTCEPHTASLVIFFCENSLIEKIELEIKKIQSFVMHSGKFWYIIF